ncbi:MAG TPA: hypothetical protein DEQ38_01800 [Elusimicrobia bacterium]|nr:MAG: hypothetical protein A2089_07295 [Elusimicrobia bacterium GWD2_63_28]HCC46842.1 hypothetical protein [Elusimicrobiota bacterium]
MRSGFSRLTGFAAALAAGLLLLWGLAPLFGGEYELLAGRLAGTARLHGLERLAVSSFTALGGASEEEARQAQLLLSEELFKLRGAGVMDAEMLEKLGERGRLWAQMLVKGRLFRTGEGLVLVLKTVHLRSGRPITTVQMNVPETKDPPAPKDFRDAPADPATAACLKAAERLRSEGRAAVDLKARRWAARLRDPGYSGSGEERLPGSEIRDYRFRQEFYALLNEYYGREEPVALTAPETERLEDYIKSESAFLRDCPAAR